MMYVMTTPNSKETFLQSKRYLEEMFLAKNLGKISSNTPL